MSTPSSDAPWPVREITDPRELRALAHPLRWELLGLLAEGPLTASQCAARLGVTPANCSYHLRQLAKYGHVREAEGGRGRERPWRSRNEGITWDRDAPGASAAADALGETLDEHRFSTWRRYRAAMPGDDADWRAAAISTDVVAWLTPDELRELDRRLLALFSDYVDRDDDPTARPDGSRAVRFFAYGWGNPA
jgi:predicted ArsR family transcriptional regulator